MEVEPFSSLQTNPAAFVAGEWRNCLASFPVERKHDGAVIAQVGHATAGDCQLAVDAAAAAHRAGPPAAHVRADRLLRVAQVLQDDAAALIDGMIAEAGFTRSDAATELARGLETLRLSAEAARALKGDMVPFGGAPGGGSRIGFTVRVPVGPVLAVTPFNSPLNTVLHKVAPAYAAGNPVILKPSEKTPLTAMRLVAACAAAGMETGWIGLIQGPGSALVPLLLEDSRIAYVTFTGSTDAGRAIHGAAGLRRTQMELGAISATIVCQDAAVDRAVDLCLRAAFRKAGQVCTSIQLLCVHRDLHEQFRNAFVEGAARLRTGDPADPATDVGPMISAASAARVDAMIEEALIRGATAALRARPEGPMMGPSILENTTPDMRLRREEAFGPVCCLIPYDEDAAVIELINATPYGLAAGVFTQDLDRAFRFAAQLDMGGVHINQTSSSRMDVMPYGGVKASGFGREGPDHAIREMTVEKLVTLTMVG
jgi:succinate-semialdehyde dehydrogenase/glutarate-semialdehyde dehydrogenase